MIITSVHGKDCFFDTGTIFDLPESELENVKTEPRMRITAQIEVQIDVDKDVSESVDAGHALPGRHNSILFEEELVHAQCRKCNRYGGGEMQAYKTKLIEIFGSKARYDYWTAHKKDHVEYTDFDYEQIANIYREKVKEFLK